MFGADPYYHYLESFYNWSTDGAVVYFSQWQGYVTIISRLEIGGSLQNWFFSPQDTLIDFHHGRMLRYGETTLEGSGYYTNWVITDVTTLENKFFQQFDSSNPPMNLDYNLHWNHDSTYALVEQKTCIEHECKVEAYEVFDWDTGSRRPLPDNLTVWQCEPVASCENDAMWSPDGASALLPDKQQRLHLFEVATGATFPINVENVVEWYWLTDGDLLLVTDQPKSIDRYDVQTHTLTRLIRFESFSVWGLEPAPNGSAVGVMGDELVTVFDLESGKKYTWPQHSQANGSGGAATGFKWHKDGQWFLSGGNTYYMDSINSSAIMIHRIGDTNRRELTECGSVYFCTGFVPDHVLPHLAPEHPNP